MEKYNKAFLEELLRKFSAGTCTQEEELILNRWLNSIDENPDQPVFKNYQHFQSSRQDILREVLLKTGQSRQPRISTMKWASIAATILFIAVAGILYVQRDTPVQYITRSATLGQMLLVELPDSSFVYVSPNSSVKYPERFGESSRDVYLKGEAFFEVHRNTKHPFIVHTDHVSTRVLGTKFLVQAYPSLDHIDVKVAEGKVQVRDSSSTLSTLVKNQVLTYSKLGEVEIRQEIVQERSESYMERVRVKNASFNEVALRILNIYGYQLKTSNPRVLDTQFTGDIMLRQPVKVFLDKFCAVHGIKYVITGKEIVMV